MLLCYPSKKFGGLSAALQELLSREGQVQAAFPSAEWELARNFARANSSAVREFSPI